MIQKEAVESPNQEQNLTFKMGDEWFALPITSIRDVMYTPTLTPVPLSSGEVAGLINLRGHIVTAIYTNLFLGIDSETPERTMCIVLQDHSTGEMYSFIVDKVFDIESFDLQHFEPTPSNLKNAFGSIVNGIFREEDRLVISLDKNKIIEKITSQN